jgi:hypothetical protein
MTQRSEVIQKHSDSIVGSMASPCEHREVLS